jgi:hypothetical protein
MGWVTHGAKKPKNGISEKNHLRSGMILFIEKKNQFDAILDQIRFTQRS